MSNMNWTPVKKALPKNSGMYIVTIIDDDCEDEYCLTVGTSWYGTKAGWDEYRVIAWAPLPAPYTGEGGE